MSADAVWKHELFILDFDFDPHRSLVEKRLEDPELRDVGIPLSVVDSAVEDQLFLDGDLRV